MFWPHGWDECLALPVKIFWVTHNDAISFFGLLAEVSFSFGKVHASLDLSILYHEVTSLKRLQEELCPTVSNDASRKETNRCFSCQARDSHNSKRQQLQLWTMMMLSKRWKQMFFWTHRHCLSAWYLHPTLIFTCAFVYFFIVVLFVFCIFSFALFSTQRQCLAPLSYYNFPFCRT